MCWDLLVLDSSVIYTLLRYAMDKVNIVADLVRAPISERGVIIFIILHI